MTRSAPHRWLVIAGRVLAGLALLAVSTYYLLASIPFAYYHFLQFAHFSWLPLFIRTHSLVMALGVVVLIAALPHVDRRWTARLGLAGLLFAGWMGLTTWMPALQSYENAAAMSVVPLVLLMAAALLDLASRRSPDDAPLDATPRVRTLLGASLLASLLASAIYLTLSLSMLRSSADQPSSAELAIAALASVLGHAVFFVVPGAVLALIDALTRPRFRWLGRGIAIAGVAAVVALLVNRIGLSTLLMPQAYALALSLMIGLSVSLYWLALLGHARPVSRTADTAWLPVQPQPHVQWVALTTSAFVLVAVIFVLPRMLLLADWGSSLQKTLVLAAWASAVLLVRALPDRLRTRIVALGVTAIAGVALLTTGTMAAGTRATTRLHGSANLDFVLERHAAVDPALGTILDLVRPTLSDRDFFERVHEAGDRTDQRGLPAVPLRIVPEIGAVPAYRPHIFVIVVDSLRPDYLGAYNPAATFTPSIAAFARDSIVMRRAFTPYAGTALSQPAIWAGGLIPRVNYVQPFSAVNNLERLVNAAGYRKYVSMDEISKLTLTDPSSIRNLEPALEHPDRLEEMFKLDLCASLEELGHQLDRDASDTRPIFMFTQPQNLHIRVLASSKFPQYEGVDIGGADFFKPAVNALQRIDGCFGRFVDDLKRRSLYDDSVIVLTSDHGDAYGQQGRWGHAFYLMPETLRVPLIVHVPARLRTNRSWRSDAVTLTTDVTPTLYDLLGQGYQPNAAIVGRSLGTATGEADAPRNGPILVQSSYSRAFGLLDANGRWLYVVNANQVTESYFELDGERETEVALDATLRTRLRAQLLEQLQAFNAFYVGR